MLHRPSALVAVGIALAWPLGVIAQQTPPISGTTGTIALEGTVKAEYGAAHTIVVGAIDGTEHVFHFAKDLLVHGSNTSGEDALKGMRTGTTVVVHYTAEGATETVHEFDRVGADGLQVGEGVVTRIDRARKQITVKFDGGKTETLELTDRAAADVGKDVDKAAMNTTRVAVYYTDEAGHKVVHYFKKK